MSRIGRAPISLPKGVDIDLKDSGLTVKGPKGSLTQAIHPEMEINIDDDGVLTVQRPSDSNNHRALHGLTRALINNMVVGVSDGFSKTLQIEGVGYRAAMEGKTLVLNVGHSHPIHFEPEGHLEFEVEDRGKTIKVSGIDKQLVGEYAARIRKTRPPEPYKGKGIRYEGEYVRRKAGKAGKV
jgi:large subunit ribosomal protein L6